MRNRDRHVRVSDHSDMHSSEEEDDPVPSPSLKKPTTKKDYRNSFYGSTFSVYNGNYLIKVRCL